MAHWETDGQSDEWYTPAYIFEAMGVRFDMDVAAPQVGKKTHVPASVFISDNSLSRQWTGFVWMNPPFGSRNAIRPWLEKFFMHGNGVALVPDRTSAPWFQEAAKRCTSMLFISPKVKFERPDGTLGKSPSTGTALLGAGWDATQALERAAKNGLGFLAQTELRASNQRTGYEASSFAAQTMFVPLASQS